MQINDKRTWVEISKSALVSNINQIQKLTRPAQIGLVIKSNAYGHGAQAISTFLEQLNTASNITWLCTAGIQEAIELRQWGSSKHILAMAYYDMPLSEVLKNNIDLAIYNLNIAYQLDACARKIGKKARIHIKIDTGLSRLGLQPDQVLLFIKTIIQECKALEIIGIFTHLADTNNIDQSFSYQQLDLFNNILADLSLSGIRIPCAHALSSGALTFSRTYAYDMVRVGTMLYGLWKSDVQRKRIQEFDPTITLKPVLTWKTTIVHITDISNGSSVGYARTYTAHSNTRVALIGIGYADGYPRILSNKSYVEIDTILAPVIGIISMNIIAIDITHVPQAHVGMHVTLIGCNSAVHADTLAKQAGTINNELLTGINWSIQRCLVP